MLAVVFVLALGFLLLLVALQAPLIAAAGVVTNLLATGGAFGIVDLQARRAALAAGLPVPGVPRRLGPGVLLRDDLRDLDGLHGVILGVAVLLDAALIRLLLVAVLLRVMGRWAWYLPRWAHRLLPEVSFGHA